jgi:dTMP kinase
MRVREIIKSEPHISLKSQFHLIEAQRSHHVQEVIIPSIIENKIVICDRFIDTSYVYQNAYMSDWEWQEYLEEYPVVPDVTYFLWSANLSTIRHDRARENVVSDHFDNVSVEELNRKQELFFKLAKVFSRIVPINTDRSIETISEIIYTHVRIALEDAVHSKET